MAKDRKKLVHIHSKITDKQPRPEALEVGEIAVNNGVSGSTDRSFLSIKNADNKVVRFSSDEQMIFWTEKKEVIPFEGQVRGEDGPESTKDSGDYGSYGITNNDLLNNKSNLVIKFNQVAASNTPKSEKINGGKDIYNKLVNGTPDASREGAGIAIDMSRYAMRGANPSFSSLTITNDTTLEGDLNVNGNTKIGNGLNVTGATNINGATNITGDTTFNGNETVNGNLTVTGNTNVSGDTRIKNTLTVDGATKINNNLTVTGDTSISGNTRIDKNLTVSGNTNVSGDTNVGNNLKVTNGITADTVSATTSIKSPIISGTDITASNSVKADNVSANTITAATSVTTKDLDVSGNAKITGTTDIAGATTINNTLTVGGETLLKNTTVDGSLLVNSGATIHNGISVDGGANITGNTNLNGNLTVTGDTSLKATTATSISATSVTAPTISGTDITASNSVKANNVSANTITAATSVTTKDLDVSGNGKINNLSARTLTVSGNTNLKGDVTIDGKTVFNGEVEFEEPIKFESACPQKITATTIGDAICEAFDRSVITIEKNTNPSDTRLATVYTVKQNGQTVNTIEVAKDKVLKSAETVKVNNEWYIRLTWITFDPDTQTEVETTTDVSVASLVKDIDDKNPNGLTKETTYNNIVADVWYENGQNWVSANTTSNIHASGNLIADGKLIVSGDTVLGGKLNVSGNTTLKNVTANTINVTSLTATSGNVTNLTATTFSAGTISASTIVTPSGLSKSLKWSLGTPSADTTGYNGSANKTITIPSSLSHIASAHTHVSSAVTRLDGYSIASTAAQISSTDTLNQALGKLQKSINGKQGTLTAGRAIDITNNVVSLSLPISAGTGTNSIIEGNGTKASGSSSHAEGNGTTASGSSSHAEGEWTKANGNYSHAEGNYTTASGYASHAEGSYTHANGSYSHAEGYETTASSESSHAEGYMTTASGIYSHAEGYETTASGSYSHAEGYTTIANDSFSHAEGLHTVTNNMAEHASGIYNISRTGETDNARTLFTVGNGAREDARHNAFEIRRNGDTYVNGNVTANAFYATSDERLKENIENVSYAKMANAANINIKSFNFKSDEEKKTVIGVIAQDVEKENLGFIVSTSNDGMKAVDYTGLSLLKIAYLEQKIKELENIINELKQNKQ